MSKKLLVTGFGQFDRFAQNPSGDLAGLVDGQTFHEVAVRGLRLEVSWDTSWPVLQRAVREFQPDALIAFGLASDSAGVRLETKARNQAGLIPDCYSNFPRHSYIIQHGPETYPTTLPVDWLLEQLNNSRPASGIPVGLSEDAGSYLCNYLFYSIMHHLEGTVAWRGFVHIPAYPDPGNRATFNYSIHGLREIGAEVIRLVCGWMGSQGNV